jgi:hypothetical protein
LNDPMNALAFMIHAVTGIVDGRVYPNRWLETFE